MDIILVVLLVLLVGIASSILYLNLKSKPKDDNENKEFEEIANLKTEIQNLKDTLNNTINTSLGSMSTSFNNLSTGVTKDMTEALTKVDEKVGNFNQQVQLLNQSQEGITKILAGVKKYGTLAEFSLDALIKDLLPASQFMTNVKMKRIPVKMLNLQLSFKGMFWFQLIAIFQWKNLKQLPMVMTRKIKGLLQMLEQNWPQLLKQKLKVLTKNI
jgi:DNA recombination protein RmuC